MRDFCVFVVPEQLPVVWPRVAHYLARTDAARHDAEDIRALVERGSHQLWLVLHDGCLAGACVTGMVTYPKGRAVRISWLGGDGAEWDEAIEDIRLFARAAGAAWLEIEGRRGWLRRLSGFEELETVMECAL